MAMTYSQVREQALNGDVLLQEARTPEALVIRALTGQQMNHVGVLVWMKGGLWLAEMRGKKGFTISPASQRVEEMRKKGFVYYGKAPEVVRKHSGNIEESVLRHRAENPPYSWWTLVSVFFSQLIRKHTPHAHVCSTFVQEVWKDAHYTMTWTADPGDFVRHCQRVSSIGDD